MNLKHGTNSCFAEFSDLKNAHLEIPSILAWNSPNHRHDNFSTPLPIRKSLVSVCSYQSQVKVWLNVVYLELYKPFRDEHQFTRALNWTYTSCNPTILTSSGPSSYDIVILHVHQQQCPRDGRSHAVLPRSKQHKLTKFASDFCLNLLLRGTKQNFLWRKTFS